VDKGEYKAAIELLEYVFEDDDKMDQRTILAMGILILDKHLSKIANQLEHIRHNVNRRGEEES